MGIRTVDKYGLFVNKQLSKLTLLRYHEEGDVSCAIEKLPEKVNWVT